MDKKNVIKRQKGLLVRSIGHNIYILDAKRNAFYTLNETGAQIWRFIHKPRTIEEIFTKMKKIYKISEDKLKEDILNFIKMGLKNKILIISSSLR
jgi:GTP-binding protein EngB required for normal cell division